MEYSNELAAACATIKRLSARVAELEEEVAAFKRMSVEHAAALAVARTLGVSSGSH